MGRRADLRRWSRPAAALAAVLVVLAALAGTTGQPAGAATATIVPRSGTTAAAWNTDSTSSLVVSAPSSSVAGDVLITTLSVGRMNTRTLPTVTAPAGWDLIGRTDANLAQSTLVYRHVYASGEHTYTFATNMPVGGFGFVAAFGGVDLTSPVDQTSSWYTTSRTRSVTTTPVTTTAPGDLLVASYFGYHATDRTTWQAPSGMSQVAQAKSSKGARTGELAIALQAAAGGTGAKRASAPRTSTAASGSWSPSAPPPRRPAGRVARAEPAARAAPAGRVPERCR
jgi:hypothetical protein